MSPQVSSTQEERKEEPKQETALDTYLSMIKKSNEVSDFHVSKISNIFFLLILNHW